MNADKLKGKMREHKYTINSLAKKIGMNRSTLFRKLRYSDHVFTVREAVTISKLLDLTDDEVLEIFFAS